MAADNKTTTLKFEIKSGVLLNLAGVDYEDNNVNESKDIHDDEKYSHKEYIEQDERVDA